MYAYFRTIRPHAVGLMRFFSQTALLSACFNIIDKSCILFNLCKNSAILKVYRFHTVAKLTMNWLVNYCKGYVVFDIFYIIFSGRQ